MERRRPAGISIGRFLQFDRYAVFNEGFDAVIRAIDGVHGVGGAIPTIPLINAGSTERATDAWFAFHIDANGEVLPRSISVRVGVPYRRIKTLHEIGHFIDGCALPGPGFASIQAIELDDWRLAIEESQLFGQLTEIELGLAGQERARLACARQVDELWARSYAQFVANRSGDPALLAELQGTSIAPLDDLRFPLQWDDDDFVSVADAIDALFWRLGWTARV